MHVYFDSRFPIAQFNLGGYFFAPYQAIIGPPTITKIRDILMSRSVLFYVQKHLFVEFLTHTQTIQLQARTWRITAPPASTD
jgi:hypothetical protein